VRATPGALKEVASLFLRLGSTAFGGPAAHIAMMEDEVVRRRRWLSREEFLDLLGATHLIPGPNSTEMAIHIGRQRAGVIGLVAAGLAFIMPAVLITLAAAWTYTRFGALPQAAAVLYGVKPVVIAVVAQALWSLARTAVKTTFLAAVGLAATAVNLLGGHEIALLMGAGVLVALARRGPRDLFASLATPVATAPAAAAAIGATFSLGALFLFFMKVGAVLFGSGYVLLAFLRADLVDRWHWLSEAQLLDAVAVGQITPGPVHDRHLHRLSARRHARRAGRDARHLPSRFRLRRGDRAARSPAATLPHRRRVPRRRQRRFPRVARRRHVAPRPGCPGRPAQRGARGWCSRPARPLSRELGLARARRKPGRLDGRRPVVTVTSCFLGLLE